MSICACSFFCMLMSIGVQERLIGGRVRTSTKKERGFSNKEGVTFDMRGTSQKEGGLLLKGGGLKWVGSILRLTSFWRSYC